MGKIETIEIPAVIRKMDIPKTREFHGKVNAQTWTPTEGGITYEPGELMFVVFAGARDARDGLFHGVYRFQRAPEGELDRIAFSELPDARQQQASVESEKDNGI